MASFCRRCPANRPAHREIIDLVYYHEKSVEEAAEIVGIPENKVKTRMFYVCFANGGKRNSVAKPERSTRLEDDSRSGLTRKRDHA